MGSFNSLILQYLAPGLFVLVMIWRLQILPSQPNERGKTYLAVNFLFIYEILEYIYKLIANGLYYYFLFSPLIFINFSRDENLLKSALIIWGIPIVMYSVALLINQLVYTERQDGEKGYDRGRFLNSTAFLFAFFIPSFVGLFLIPAYSFNFSDKVGYMWVIITIGVLVAFAIAGFGINWWKKYENRIKGLFYKEYLLFAKGLAVVEMRKFGEPSLEELQKAKQLFSDSIKIYPIADAYAKRALTNAHLSNFHPEPLKSQLREEVSSDLEKSGAFYSRLYHDTAQEIKYQIYEESKP